MGGTGNDNMIGDYGADQLLGGEGNDTIYGNDGGDEIAGGPSDDLILSGNGADQIFGGPGDDKIYHNDKILTTKPDDARDIMICGEGNDEVWINVNRDGDEASKDCEIIHAE
jgi:Ca2+-binding RTX toxin-like protein